jgi:hypothetical protein
MHLAPVPQSATIADPDLRSESGVQMMVADWTDDDAYNYLEGLEPSALAWELLRRNRGYQEAFTTKAALEPYGLRFALDPTVDARGADPIWRWTFAPAIAVYMAPAPASGVSARRLLAASAFHRSAPDGLHLRFASGVQAHLPPSCLEAASVAAVLPFNGDFLRRLGAARALNACLFGRSSAASTLSRAARLRVARAIRAHDARGQGASHRQIAKTILRQVFSDSIAWRTSPTRALVMRLSAAGGRLVNGDYARLLGGG